MQSKDISLMRIIAQGLVTATQGETATEAVRHMMAIQAQEPKTIYRAIELRSKASTTDIEASFATRELVRCRPMRGTLHMCTGDDYHLLRAAFQKPEAWRRRREQGLGVTQERYDALVSTALELLDGAAVTREELVELWRSQGLLTGQEPDLFVKRLMFYLDGDGLVAQTQPKGQQARYVSVQDLPKTSLSSEDALIEVAHRYAYSHGPVTVADFARWGYCSMRKAGQALSAALHHQDPLLPLRVVRLSGQQIVAQDIDAPLTSDTLIFRRDLPDLLEVHRDEAQRLMALPRFDELHNGYQDRQWLCDEEGEYLICPSRNGTNRPFVVYRGRLLGALSPQGLVYIGKPSARLQKQAERLMAALS